jgi:hypothetical protein
MKSKIILFALFFILASKIFGQSNELREVVYLKNGSVLKGNITEWIPNESITLQLADGSVFLCKITEIEKVKREFSAQNPNSKPQLLNASNSKYQSNVAIGYGAQSGKYGLDLFSFNWIYGMNLNSHHFIGGGTGIRHFDQINMTMIPIMLDWRYRVNDNKPISPYVNVSAGYSINVSNGIDNSGFLFDPRIGLEFNVQGNLLSFDIGYHTQQTAFYTFDPVNPFEPGKIFRFSEALKFSLGLSF